MGGLAAHGLHAVGIRNLKPEAHAKQGREHARDHLAGPVPSIIGVLAPLRRNDQIWSSGRRNPIRRFSQEAKVEQVNIEIDDEIVLRREKAVSQGQPIIRRRNGTRLHLDDFAGQPVRHRAGGVARTVFHHDDFEHSAVLTKTVDHGSDRMFEKLFLLVGREDDRHRRRWHGSPSYGPRQPAPGGLRPFLMTRQVVSSA